MKKLIYLLVVIVAVACNVTPTVPTPVAPTIPSAPAANAPQQDWKFEVVINGTSHKAEGTYIYPHYDVATGHYFALEKLRDADNIAWAVSTTSLSLSMNDKSESTYISGDHINLGLSFNNLSLGINEVAISLTGGTSLLIQEQWWNSSGFQYTQGTLSFPYGASAGSFSVLTKIPINITDLGTQLGVNTSQHNNPIPGNTIKGNYSGTVYLCDTTYYDYTVTPFTINAEFNTPLQLSINFEAIREY
jgi:hypothetical protein